MTLDVTVIFRYGWSLHSVLSKVKNPLPAEKQSKVLYRIPVTVAKPTLVRPREY